MGSNVKGGFTFHANHGDSPSLVKVKFCMSSFTAVAEVHDFRDLRGGKRGGVDAGEVTRKAGRWARAKEMLGTRREKGVVGASFFLGGDEARTSSDSAGSAAMTFTLPCRSPPP